MTTIVDTWVDPAGGPIAEALVTARLRTSATDPNAPGFDSSALTTVVPPVSTMTNAAGQLTLELTPNANFDDDTPGSYYEITVKAGQRTYPPILVEVPAAGGPYTLQDLLTQVPAAITSPRQTMTPRLYTGDGGGYTEIGYGTAPAARSCKFRTDSESCKATYMIRCDTDTDQGTAGKFYALELPVPADLSLGNGEAEIIGIVRFGVFPLTHKSASVHLGRVGDPTNPNFCYFVGDDTVAVANNSWGITLNNIRDYHVKIEFDR